jgi:hypothetical protein
MNKDPFKDKLIPYADGELDAAQAAELEAHIEQCAECRAELQSIRSLFSALRNAEPEDPGELFWKQFRNNVREQIDASPRMRAAHTARALPSWAGRAAMAAALLAAVISGAWFLRPHSKPVTKALAPAVAATPDPAPAPQHTHEELVLMAALKNAALAPDITQQITPQTAAPAPDNTQSSASDNSLESFPFAEDQTTELAEYYDSEVYIFDDTLTGEYIMPDVLNQLTDQETQSILQSLEQEDQSKIPSAPKGVS